MPPGQRGQGASFYAPGESLEQTAKIIANAVGPSGSNLEYFENFVDDLVRKGLPVDSYLQKLGELVRNSVHKEKLDNNQGSCRPTDDSSCHDFNVFDSECLKP